MNLSIKEQIQQNLTTAYQPLHLEIENESYMHGGGNTESHFKVIIVSEAFKNSHLLARHRMVYDTLQQLMQRIHALSVHAFTPQEWALRQSDTTDLASPACRGGEKSRE